MNREEVAVVMKVLVAGFPREALEPETVALWGHELARLPNGDAARDAAFTIVRSSSKFPSFREFRQTYRASAARLSPPALEEGQRQPMPLDAKAWLEQHVPGTTVMRARPVWARYLRRRRMEPMFPPTDAEKHDAIVVLREGAMRDGEIGGDDALYHEAERIFLEGSV